MGSEGETSTGITSPLRGEVGAQRRVRGAKLSKNAVAKARGLRKQSSDAEHKFWGMVRNRHVEGHKFLRQHAIGPYVADFICRERMLVVEIDGGQHAESTRDVTRTQFLNARGYSVLRFWNNEVLSNLDGCWLALTAVLGDSPSPDLRFAPATLSPEGRGDAAAPPMNDTLRTG